MDDSVQNSPAQGNPTQTAGSEPVPHGVRFFVGFTAVVVALAVGLLAAWYYTNSKEKARAVVHAAIVDADEQFALERNYDASIQTLEKVLDEAKNAGPDVECNAKLELAHKKLRFHGDESMIMYGDIFNNPAYNVKCRANAVTFAMMQVASFTGPEGPLTLEFVRENVFGPGHLDVLPPGTPLATQADVERAAALAFEKSYEMYPSHVSAIGAARYYSGYLRGGYKKWDKNSGYIVKMKDAYDRAMPLLEEARRKSLEENVHSNTVEYSLGSRLTPLMVFALTGHGTKEAFYSAAEDVFAYAEVFRDQSYFPEVLQAITAHKYVSVMALLEKRPFTAAQKDKARQVLEYLYRLPKEDLAYRAGIRSLASRPKVLFYEPTVYIAKEVDPRLKEVLINDIGGWTEENFK